jgi:uncharacterized protein (TIGR03067 family)
MGELLAANYEGKVWKMKKLITMAVVLGLTILVWSGCATAPKQGMSTLQGTWVGHELGGQMGECRMTVSGNSVKVQSTRGDEWYAGKLALIEGTSPKQAVLLVEGCNDPQYVGKTSRVIYRLEGDTLTMAGCEPGFDTVPASFESSEATRSRGFVFTRQ